MISVALFKKAYLKQLILFNSTNHVPAQEERSSLLLKTVF